jgi:hypothetical protein
MDKVVNNLVAAHFFKYPLFSDIQFHQNSPLFIPIYGYVLSEDKLLIKAIIILPPQPERKRGARGHFFHFFSFFPLTGSCKYVMFVA